MIRSYVVTFAFVTFRMWMGLPLWEGQRTARVATVAWLSWVVPLFLTDVVLQARRWSGLGRGGGR